MSVREFRYWHFTDIGATAANETLMPGVVALGVILMRGFAGLLAYLAGVSAIFGIGIVGLMALQSPTGRTPIFSPRCGRIAYRVSRQAGQATGQTIKRRRIAIRSTRRSM